jgi:hypothetical protein
VGLYAEFYDSLVGLHDAFTTCCLYTPLSNEDSCFQYLAPIPWIMYACDKHVPTLRTSSVDKRPSQQGGRNIQATLMVILKKTGIVAGNPQMATIVGFINASKTNTWNCAIICFTRATMSDGLSLNSENKHRTRHSQKGNLAEESKNQKISTY